MNEIIKFFIYGTSFIGVVYLASQLRLIGG